VKASPTVAPEAIAERILIMRGQRVILDADLATLYGVETGRLNEQVRRNAGRFPADFMFTLSQEDWNALRSQIAILKAGRGQHRKYLLLPGDARRAFNAFATARPVLQ